MNASLHEFFYYTTIYKLEIGYLPFWKESHNLSITPMTERGKIIFESSDVNILWARMIFSSDVGE